MLRLEPWGAAHAFPGTSSFGRLSASIGSGWGSLVQRRGFWIGMWVAAAVAELLALRAIALQLRLLQNRIGDDPAAAELVTSASDELSRSLEELRELARGLHPVVLEHGLGAALGSLASRSPVPTTVSCDTDGSLSEAVELAAYFVASEALANVAKYSQATHATVRVSRDASWARIEIADDGIGGADEGAGTGLRGLADRVEALDGRLRVTSPTGGGTTVTAELPCAS